MNHLKIAVTGATGLVGRHLVDYLSKKGYSVVAFVHSLANAESFLVNWHRQGVIVIEADINDDNVIKRGLLGVDIVVHAAGIVDPYGLRQRIFAVNVEGTRNLLNIAKEVLVKQFILVSSLSVITGQNDQWGVSEEAPLRKCGESYADSKVEAELLVMSEANKGSIAVTAVRPGFIYGPGERAWLPRLIQSISQGKAALIDGGTKETNVIYVENLNAAIEATFLNEKAYGSVYNLTDGQAITKKQLFDAIADELKLPRVTRVIPSMIARPIFEIVSSLAPFLPIKTQRGLARYSRGCLQISWSKSRFFHK